MAVAGQAAVSLSLPVKAVPAPLAVSSSCVVIAVQAAESIACLSVELRIKDALSGFPIAITHFSPGGGLGGGQQERDAEAAAEPERRHGQAALRRSEWMPGAESSPRVPSFALDQVVLSTLLPDSVLTGREPCFGA